MIKQELDKLANPKKARILQSFFKTGKGQYGEDDIFLGIVVPEQRKIAKKYQNIPLSELSKLINSNVHEYRLTGFMLLTYKFEKKENQKEIFDFYIKYHKYANNWDIIDVTAPKIIGRYLFDKDKSILYKFARSKELWEKRIAIISTMTFIQNNKFEDTIKISEILLNDNHDLIHKAVGWMLREVGKRDIELLRLFLKKHYHKMPRTMLRYAIEKFDENERKEWLKK